MKIKCLFTQMTIVLSVCSILLNSSPVVAQSQIEYPSMLEEVIVTATRRLENLQDVPISIATLSGENFSVLFAGGEDVLALAGRVPGLYLESSNGRAAPRFYIRGLGNTDFDLGASQPVSFIMDDVVLENVVLKSFPIFDVNQVEVIRGPQGTLFGRNTTAGIVKVDTRRPTEEFNGFINGSYGTFGSGNVETAIGGQLGNSNFSGRISGLYQTRDDWIDNGFTGEENILGNFDEKAARLQLLWQPSDSFSGLFLAQARDMEGTSSIFRANVFDTGSNKLNQNYDRDTVYYDGGDNNPQEYKGNGLTLNLEWFLPNSSTLTSITSRQKADGFSRGDIDGGVVDFSGTAQVPPGISFDPAAPVFGQPTLTFPGTIRVPAVTQDGADTKQFTQELRLASGIENDFWWQVGAYYFDSDLVVETENFASHRLGRTQNTIVQYDNKAWAIFGQGRYDFSDMFNLTGGLRYTDDQRKFEVVQLPQLWVDLGIPESVAPPSRVSDDNISWDLTGNYILNQDSILFARVATGFRGPTIQGRDVAILESPTIAQSETVISYELGYKADLAGGRLRINAAVFHYTVNDIQLSIIGGVTGGNQVINANKADATGFEMDLQWAPLDHLYITAGVAYNKTEIKDADLRIRPCGSTLCEAYQYRDENGEVPVDGNPLPRTPKTNFNLTVSWQIPVGTAGEIFVFTDWVYYGKTLMPLYYTPEFVTNNQFEGGLKVGYMHFKGDWEIALFGRNITNENNVKGYIDFSNLTGFVNEPAIWGVSFSKNFGRY